MRIYENEEKKTGSKSSFIKCSRGLESYRKDTNLASKIDN